MNIPLIGSRLALLCGVTFGTCTFALAQTAPNPPPAPYVQTPDSQKYTDEANALAGTDLQDINTLCLSMPQIGERMTHVPIPPASKAFDNLYFVGIGKVGSWAIKTSAGIILIDTLDNTEEAEQFIAGGLKSLGMDPAQIKYIVVTHGHGDHYGGAKYLQETYHPHILMSPADWKLMDSYYPLRNGKPTVPPPAHDMDIKDGQKLTLGDTTVTLYITPGHTPGTVSAIFPVKDHGTTHMAALLGGTGFYTIHSQADGDVYETSLTRFAGLAKSAGADVAISNHPINDDSIPKLSVLRAYPDRPNPFLIGQGNVQRFYKVLDYCLKAAVARVGHAG